VELGDVIPAKQRLEQTLKEQNPNYSEKLERERIASKEKEKQKSKIDDSFSQVNRLEPSGAARLFDEVALDKLFSVHRAHPGKAKTKRRQGDSELDDIHQQPQASDACGVDARKVAVDVAGDVFHRDLLAVSFGGDFGECPQRVELPRID